MYGAEARGPAGSSTQHEVAHEEQTQRVVSILAAADADDDNPKVARRSVLFAPPAVGGKMVEAEVWFEPGRGPKKASDAEAMMEPPTTVEALC